MDDFQSETDSDYTSYWRDWFISSRGNEYFCEIDEEYLTDRFNLTGLNTEVHYYQHALDLITDVFDLDCDDEMREQIEKSARHLYGMVHARYIVTTRGLAKMVEKYKKSDFGRCPRVYCEGHSLLPTGLSDVPNNKSIKLYCARCEDLYNPKSSRHASIDGAYFSTSFATTLFQVYPALVPAKSLKRFEPKIFGFKVHSYAALARYQDQDRRLQRRRLQDAGVIPALPASTAATNAQGEAVDVSGVAGTGIGSRQQIFVEDAEDTDGMRTFEDEERELERESTQAQLTGAGGGGGAGAGAAQNLGALRAAALQRHIQAAQAAQLATEQGDEAMEG